MKKMNLKWMLLTLVSCAFVFFGCSKDDDPQDPEPDKATLSVSAPETGLEFKADGETKEVTITTNQTEWTATLATADDTTWCKLSQKDKTLTVEVVKNEVAEREAEITVTAGSGENVKSLTIAVKQQYVAPAYKLLDLYEKDGVKGIVYEVSEDGRSGKIMSIEGLVSDFSQKLEKLNIGADNTADGAKNMEVFKALEGWHDTYPGIAWADDMNKDGVTGWYIPSQEEIKSLWAFFDNNKEALNAALEAEGGSIIQDGYWFGNTNQAYMSAKRWALCSSTTGVEGDNTATVWSIGYKILQFVPEFEKIKQGVYRSGYYAQFNANEPETYQFRAIHKF